MIYEKKFVNFLLVITVASSVNGRSIEDETNVGSLLKNVDDIVEITTEIPIIAEEVRTVETTEEPVRDKVETLSFILDSLKVVNEKALSFVQSYIADLNIKNGEKPDEINKSLLKHPVFNHFLDTETTHSIETALSKYKDSLLHIATKVKTIPATIIKHFAGTGLLEDPVENVISSQADMTLNPENEANAETTVTVSVSETSTTAPKTTDKPETSAKPDENSEKKPEDTPEKTPEQTSVSEPAKDEARKLGTSDIEAWPESDTEDPRDIVERVKSVVDAMKKVNEEAFELVQAYLNRLTDSNRIITIENEYSTDAPAVENEKKENCPGDCQ